MGTIKPLILIGEVLLVLLVQYFIIKSAVKTAIKEALKDQYLKGGASSPEQPGNVSAGGNS